MDKTINNSDRSLPDSAQTKLGFASIAPALINGFFSLGSQAYNQINYKNNRDFDLWYNSPAEQMYRMKHAGINPNMAVGNISPGQQHSNPPQVSNPFERAINDIANVAQLRNNLLQNDYLAEQLNGLRLDNKFKSQSYQSRLLTVAYRTWSAYYSQELSQRRITYQGYVNKMAELNKNYQEWLNSPLGDVDLKFYTIDANGQRVESHRNFNFEWSPQQSTYLGQLLRNHIGDVSAIQGYDFNEIMNPLRYTYQGILNDRADIAREFERIFNMPFGHSNIWTGLATSLMMILSEKYPFLKKIIPRFE